MLFRMVSLLWVKLRISCKQDKTGMRGERISGILQGITDQLVQVDHYVQVSQRIQGKMAKLPDIPVISLPCTMQTLSRYTGKNTGILAVCDENFAGGIRAMMSDDEEDLDR